jgi:hypothetical protein
MTDANWGMGIGGTIAGVLMIISWGIFIKEVYDFYTHKSPPRSKPPTLPTDSKSVKALFSPCISSEFL